MAVADVPDTEEDLCGECNKKYDAHNIVHIADILETTDYVVPSFPVMKAKLQHVKYFFDDDIDEVYDGFIQAMDSVALKSGSVLRLCPTYNSAFFIDHDEFERSVDIGDYVLLDHESEKKVFVIWKWNQVECGSETSSELEESDNECISTDEEMNDSSEQEQQTEDCSSTTVYTVTFKCIGTTKERRYQEILAEVASNERKGVKAEIRISPEPNNRFDARAIAFECRLNTKWERIGYMVSEVLSEVHEALHKREIALVELGWVKFITHWSRCTPGWYCGVKVSKKGPWSNEVLRCRSTI